LIKLLIKLAIVAMVANMAWHVMTAYMAYWKFKDAVQQTTQFGNDKSLVQLRQRVLQLATDHDLPIGEDDFSIQREGLHTITDGSYSRPIDLLPWYRRDWPFKFHIDTASDAPMTGDDR
jgi:hypothetical protein